MNWENRIRVWYFEGVMEWVKLGVDRVDYGTSEWGGLSRLRLYILYVCWSIFSMFYWVDDKNYFF